MKILVVEDEPLMLTTLEFRLRKHGFDVVLASDGLKAKEILATGNMPDLIVADILMPNMTGMELLDHIRKDLKLKLPIIMISAIENHEIVLQAFRNGANDFISKPFQPNELVLRIRRFLQD